MHIAIIGSIFSIHVVRWVNALVDRGFKITLFSMHDTMEQIDPKVRFIKLPFRNPYGYILNVLYLRFKIHELKPDIIHSFYAFGYGFLGRSTGYSPHIISVLGSDIYDDIKNRFYKRVIVQNIEKANIVCSTSNVMAQQIKDVTKRDLEIRITPFGVDIEKFSVIQGLKDNNYELTVGTVKLLEDKYGIDILMESFALFTRKHHDIKTRLILVGNGSKREELILLAKRLNIYEKCEFVGAVKHDEVPYWLNKLDIFLALSRLHSESFGVSVIEAMSCKLPVIVSNVGGLKEVTKNGKTGFIVPNEDPFEAAKKIEYLYKNPEQRNELGENARSEVVLKYSWSQSVEIMSNIYRNL